MDATDIHVLVKRLSAGFETLQDEYQKLFGQHQTLERKLATAREQYNEIAKLYGVSQTATPPLSLSSSPALPKEAVFGSTSAPEILERRPDSKSREAANKVRIALAAANTLERSLPAALGVASQGVKIWAGPSADKVEGSSCMMPSISESPLEQDFTVEGKPSKLGCPFASMATKKLSSHAASVLSRYNHSNSAGAHGSVGAASTPLSTANRINGRESFSQRQSKGANTVDPIQAEICGISDHGSHHVASPQQNRSRSQEEQPAENPENADAGVCPIRFLDQHSPEEVATYFEKHKHELPRSHEVCVMRYQSNEEQIKELDAKYGNLVSMIQGLGQKHKDMLPEEPDEDAEEDAGNVLDDAKVRKWASSVSAQAPGEGTEDEFEERQPHFERPLREIRVGESPSRPWGISVPAKYLEQAESETSSKLAHIAQAAPPDVPPTKQQELAHESKKPAGKCPFGHGANAGVSATKPMIIEPTPSRAEGRNDTEPAPKVEARPVLANETREQSRAMVFSGPVFIGYSPEDAAKILSGLKMTQ